MNTPRWCWSHVSEVCAANLGISRRLSIFRASQSFVWQIYENSFMHFCHFTGYFLVHECPLQDMVTSNLSYWLYYVICKVISTVANTLFYLTSLSHSRWPDISRSHWGNFFKFDRSVQGLSFTQLPLCCTEVHNNMLSSPHSKQKRSKVTRSFV